MKAATEIGKGAVQGSELKKIFDVAPSHNANIGADRRAVARRIAVSVGPDQFNAAAIPAVGRVACWIVTPMTAISED